MIVHVTFKRPDAVRDAIEDAIDNRREIDEEEGIVREDGFYEELREQLDEKLRPWFRHGEYVDIQVDTDEDTATVIKAGRR